MVTVAKKLPKRTFLRQNVATSLRHDVFFHIIRCAHCCRFSQEFILTNGFMSKQSSENGYLSDVGPAFIQAGALERGKLLTKTIETSRDQNNRINIHEARIKIAVKNSSAASMAGLYPRPKVGQCPAREGVH